MPKGDPSKPESASGRQPTSTSPPLAPYRCSYCGWSNRTGGMTAEAHASLGHDGLADQVDDAETTTQIKGEGSD